MLTFPFRKLISIKVEILIIKPLLCSSPISFSILFLLPFIPSELSVKCICIIVIFIIIILILIVNLPLHNRYVFSSIRRSHQLVSNGLLSSIFHFDDFSGWENWTFTSIRSFFLRRHFWMRNWLIIWLKILVLLFSFIFSFWVNCLILFLVRMKVEIVKGGI